MVNERNCILVQEISFGCVQKKQKQDSNVTVTLVKQQIVISDIVSQTVIHVLVKRVQIVKGDILQ